MVTVTEYGDIGYEIVCEPDDDYKYIRCESSKAGLFFLRFGHDGLCSISILKEGKPSWSNPTPPPPLPIPDTETCKFFEVNEKHSSILPSREQYLTSLNN